MQFIKRLPTHNIYLTYGNACLYSVKKRPGKGERKLDRPQQQGVHNFLTLALLSKHTFTIRPRVKYA